MNMTLTRRHFATLATAGGVATTIGATSATASNATSSDILLQVRTKRGETFASYLVSFSTLTGKLTHRAIADRPIVEAPHGDFSINGPELHVAGQVPVLLPTDTLSAVGRSHRILTLSDDTLWIFDEQQDCLLSVSCAKRTSSTVRQTLWLGGHRLVKAMVSTENRIIVGWDNRQQSLVAFNLENGRLLGSLPLEADTLWLAKHAG